MKKVAALNKTNPDCKLKVWNHPLKNKGLFAGQRHLGLQWQGIEDSSRAPRGAPWAGLEVSSC